MGGPRRHRDLGDAQGPPRGGPCYKRLCERVALVSEVEVIELEEIEQIVQCRGIDRHVWIAWQ